MASVSGLIQNIEERQVAGGKVAYNLVVQGQSFGAGLYKPRAKVGDYVTFEVDDSRGYPNVARGTLKVGKAPPGAEEAPAAPKAASAKTAYVDTRQDTISRQAADNTAIQFVNLLVAADALPVPKTATAKNRVTVIEELVQHYGRFFYEKNTGTTYKDIRPASKESAASAPAVEDDEWEE